MSELIHIHESDGEACIACSLSDNGVRKFTTDVGLWNSTNDTCRPTMRLRPDYSISGRADPRTSALKGERKPNRRRYRDRT